MLTALLCLDCFVMLAMLLGILSSKHTSRIDIFGALFFFSTAVGNGVAVWLVNH